MIFFWSCIVAISFGTLAVFNRMIMQKNSKPLFYLAFIALPILTSLFFYQQWGDSHGLQEHLKQQQVNLIVQKEMKKYKNPQMVVNALKDRLKNDPDSAEGWYLLGRVYMSMSQFEKANAAFASAYQYNKKDIKILLQYAESIFATQKKLTPRGIKILNESLVIQPNNPQALNLLAINAYTQKHYKAAISYWEKVIVFFPPESEEFKLMSKAIAKAQKNLSKN